MGIWILRKIYSCDIVCYTIFPLVTVYDRQRQKIYREAVLAFGNICCLYQQLRTVMQIFYFSITHFLLK